ncbi:MAG TPA: YibE/F family protein [Pseudonocardia sp.]|nr:YibE/F family protein [Pseudonocardia sp.]
MPADEPDPTTGAARAARGEPGRHRHDASGGGPRTPAADVPPRPSRRSRHARRAADPGAPDLGAAAGRSPWAGAYRDDHGDAPRDDPHGGGPHAPYAGASPEDEHRTARYRGADREWPHRAASAPENRYTDTPYGDTPYGDTPYVDTAHGETSHGGSRHRDHPYRDDPYRDADRYGADRYGADRRAPYGDDGFRDPPYHDDGHDGRFDDGYDDRYDGAPPTAARQDPYRDSPYPDERRDARGRAGRGPDPRGDRYADDPDGDPHADPYDDPHAVADGASRSRPDDPRPHTASLAAGVSGTGGGELRHRPGPPRRNGAGAAPSRPNRRPGDPSGVPGELFVETTAETPAPRLDDPPPGREPADAADERAARRGPARFLGRLRIGIRPGVGLVRGTAEDGADHGPDHGQGHGHGHGPARPAGRRVRILIAALLVPCALAALVGLVLLWPTGGPPATAQPITQEPVKAQVTATRATDCTPGSGDGGCVALVVHMADGPRPGRDLVQVVPVEPGSPRFAVGDRVVLSWSGANPDDAGSYQVVDFQRGVPLAWLAGLFAVAVLLLGRWRGLAALAALTLSFAVLLLFVVPAILAGSDPLAVAVVGSCLIMFAVLYLTHGPSARTSTAVLGTLLSLALIGGLGAAFSAAAHLTGLDDQTSNLIASLGTGVDARGLLLAGVVIGALGVLDDVTVTQTSAVWELRQANPQLGARALFTAAMRIGRDHVASAVNTLVLAYAGAALPLLLLFSLSGSALADVVTAQDVATEIVRTLVGSIGLVASVPITTALAAAVAVRETGPTTEAAPA